MNEPKIAGLQPEVVALKAGETVYWCACGLSASQPFCDGSHEGTGFQPLPFTAPKDDNYYFCSCKRSASPPFCDGTHKQLAGYQHPADKPIKPE